MLPCDLLLVFNFLLRGDPVVSLVYYLFDYLFTPSVFLESFLSLVIEQSFDALASVFMLHAFYVAFMPRTRTVLVTDLDAAYKVLLEHKRRGEV